MAPQDGVAQENSFQEGGSVLTTSCRQVGKSIASRTHPASGLCSRSLRRASGRTCFSGQCTPSGQNPFKNPWHTEAWRLTMTWRYGQGSAVQMPFRNRQHVGILLGATLCEKGHGPVQSPRRNCRHTATLLSSCRNVHLPSSCCLHRPNLEHQRGVRACWRWGSDVVHQHPGSAPNAQPRRADAEPETQNLTGCKTCSIFLRPAWIWRPAASPV